MAFSKIYQSQMATQRVFIKEDMRQRKEMEVALLRQAKTWTPEQKQAYINELLSTHNRSVVVAYVFLLFFSHYAYLGRWGTWVIFILTGGGLGIWWIIDLFRIPNMINNQGDMQYKRYLAIMIENA